MLFSDLFDASTPGDFDALRGRVTALYEIGFYSEGDRDRHLELIDAVQNGTLVVERTAA